MATEQNMAIRICLPSEFFRAVEFVRERADSGCPLGRQLTEKLCDGGHVLFINDEGSTALAENNVVRLKPSPFLADWLAAARAIREDDSALAVHGNSPVVGAGLDTAEPTTGDATPSEPGARP